jgi:Tfp pilus assembly protein PilF
MGMILLGSGNCCIETLLDAELRRVEIPKSLEDLVLGHANPVGDGMTAYRNGEFARAIELFNRAIDQDKSNWQARLYLGMSYYSTGDIYAGAMHFRYLQEHCPDNEIKTKSSGALMAMEKELKLTAQQQQQQLNASPVRKFPHMS